MVVVVGAGPGEGGRGGANGATQAQALKGGGEGRKASYCWPNSREPPRVALGHVRGQAGGEGRGRLQEAPTTPTGAVPYLHVCMPTQCQHMHACVN